MTTCANCKRRIIDEAFVVIMSAVSSLYEPPLCQPCAVRLKSKAFGRLLNHKDPAVRAAAEAALKRARH